MFQFWQMTKKIFSFAAKIQIHVSVLTKDKNIEFWRENSIICYNIDKWQKYTMFVLNFGAKIQISDLATFDQKRIFEQIWTFATKCRIFFFLFLFNSVMYRM